MRFMMMMKADKNYEQGIPPTPELMAAIGAHTEEMMKAGIVVGVGGLLPSALGARIRVAGDHVSVVDGPFAETKELIGGYAIVDAKSKEEAIEHAKNFLKLHVQVLGKEYTGECEVREMCMPPDMSDGAR